MSRYIITFFEGIYDFFKVYKIKDIVKNDVIIQKNLYFCLVLNIFVLVGSVAFFDYIMGPLVRIISNDWIFVTSEWLYYILWIYPVYNVCYLFNMIWYSNIIQRCSNIPRRFDYVDMIQKTAESIFKSGFLITFIVQIWIMSHIPVIGKSLYIINMAWLYSFSIHEINWSTLGYNLNGKVSLFGYSWIYYLGYGLPLSFVTFFSPKLIGYAIYSVIYPLCVVYSCKYSNIKVVGFYMPVFTLAQAVCSLFIVFINKCFRRFF